MDAKSVPSLSETFTLAIPDGSIKKSRVGVSKNGETYFIVTSNEPSIVPNEISLAETNGLPPPRLDTERLQRIK